MEKRKEKESSLYVLFDFDSVRNYVPIAKIFTYPPMGSIRYISIVKYMVNLTATHTHTHTATGGSKICKNRPNRNQRESGKQK